MQLETKRKMQMTVNYLQTYLAKAKRNPIFRNGEAD